MTTSRSKNTSGGMRYSTPVRSMPNGNPTSSVVKIQRVLFSPNRRDDEYTRRLRREYTGHTFGGVGIVQLAGTRISATRTAKASPGQGSPTSKHSNQQASARAAPTPARRRRNR